MPTTKAEPRRARITTLTPVPVEEARPETVLEFHGRGWIREVDAPLVGNELLKIREETGSLTAGTILDAARDQASPLHRFFEWDDTVAAEQYRRWQARAIVASIIVKPIGSGTSPARAFYSVRNGDGRQYRPLSEVFENEARLKAVVRRLHTDLMHVRERYQAFRGLATLTGYEEVFDAIERALALEE